MGVLIGTEIFTMIDFYEASNSLDNLHCSLSDGAEFLFMVVSV